MMVTTARHANRTVETNGTGFDQDLRPAESAPLRDGASAYDVPFNARRRPFDRGTIGLHWTTVLLVLALFASAWLHGLAEERHSEFAPLLLGLHRSFGMTIWFVTALRLAWRLTNARMPPFPAHMTGLHRAIVKWSEYALYALLLVQPATGLLTTLFGGRPFALFAWQVPALMPRNEMLQPGLHYSHEVGAWTLGALAVGHAATALFHHFVLRDDVLECMAPVLAPTRAEQRLAAGASFQSEVRLGNKDDPSAVVLRDAPTATS